MLGKCRLVGGLMSEKKLTPKQERFCYEYAASGNAYQAALTAGYPARSARSIASENLTKPNIVEKIKEITQSRTTELIMKVERRKEKLSQLADKSEDENVVIRAIDTLNKMDGLYIQKHEVQVTKSLADVLKEIDADADG